MEPDRSQAENLTRNLEMRHGDRYVQLRKEAMKFSRFLQALSGFRLVDPDPLLFVAHVGRIVVDGVLQVGHDFEKQVRKRVEKVRGCPKASTVSGFRLLLSKKGIRKLLDFDSQGTERDLLDVTEFFANQGIESYLELYEWLEPEEHRDILLSSHSGFGKSTSTPFKVADKTADYFRVLVCHWDAVAVDKGIKNLLARADIVSVNSNRYSYKEKRAIVQLAALELNCRPIDLDQSIYRYSNREGGGTPVKTPSIKSDSGAKYCLECGKKIPRKAKYCPECGIKQV